MIFTCYFTQKIDPQRGGFLLTDKYVRWCARVPLCVCLCTRARVCVWVGVPVCARAFISACMCCVCAPIALGVLPVRQC